MLKLDQIVVFEFVPRHLNRIYAKESALRLRNLNLYLNSAKTSFLMSIFVSVLIRCQGNKDHVVFPWDVMLEDKLV